MLGTMLAVALLASADAEIAPHAVQLGGGEQHLDGATWSGPVAGMGALGLVNAGMEAARTARPAGPAPAWTGSRYTRELPICTSVA